MAMQVVRIRNIKQHPTHCSQPKVRNYKYLCYGNRKQLWHHIHPDRRQCRYHENRRTHALDHRGHHVIAARCNCLQGVPGEGRSLIRTALPPAAGRTRAPTCRASAPGAAACALHADVSFLCSLFQVTRRPWNPVFNCQLTNRRIVCFKCWISNCICELSKADVMLLNTAYRLS